MLKPAPAPRTILITGAASGIGLACAKAFTAQGDAVVGLDISAPDSAEDKSLFSAFYEMDVSQADSWEYAAAHHPQIHAIVHSAAIPCSASVFDIEEDEWDHVQAVNVKPLFLSIKHCRAALEVAGGSVTAISSVHALASSVNVAAYAASKGALSALVRQLAVELGSRGIRVNAIVPGAVDTPMLDEGLMRGQHQATTLSAAKSELASKTPLNYIIAPDDIAQAALFLSNPATARAITGTSLTVDAGVLARLSSE